jgi:hypothetical protein
VRSTQQTFCKRGSASTLIKLEALTEVGPNNEECDAVFEVVVAIHCRLPVRTDTGRAAGRSKPKGTVTKVGEKTRIAWEPVPRK